MEAETPYRLQFFCRFDRLDDYGDDAERGRLYLRAMYYYAAAAIFMACF